MNKHNSYLKKYVYTLVLENKIIPQGLYFFKKDFSFLESDKPLIPQIKDLQFLFIIIK